MLFRLEEQGDLSLFVYVCRYYNSELYVDVFKGNITQVSLRISIQFL